MRLMCCSEARQQIRARLPDNVIRDAVGKTRGQAGPYPGPSAVVETRTGKYLVTVTPDTILSDTAETSLVRIFRTVAGSYFLVGEVSPGATFVDDLSNVEAFGARPDADAGAAAEHAQHGIAAERQYGGPV